MPNTLKPCPFCGGKAKYIQIMAKTERGYADVVQCIECFAGTRYGKDKDEAFALWNRRVNA